MARANLSRWWVLERRSTTLFLIAGMLLVIHAITHGLEAFAGVEYLMHHEFPFGVAGMILGFVALLRLYPRLVPEMPILARIGVTVSVLGAVAWFVMGGAIFAEELGAEPPAWIGVAGLVMIISVALGYLAFSVASLWTDVLSQTTGLVLLTPVVVMPMNLGFVATGLGSLTGQFVVATGFAVAHVAIGATLRSEDLVPNQTEAAPGATI